MYKSGALLQRPDCASKQFTCSDTRIYICAAHKCENRKYREGKQAFWATNCFGACKVRDVRGSQYQVRDGLALLRTGHPGV